MSEAILKALMQLFALTAKQDGGVLSDERAYVERFLKQQLRLEAAAEYLNLFDRYSSGSKTAAPVPVRDSVRILKICRQINATLTQKQKVVVLLRLFELIGAAPRFSDQRVFIINTVAEVFNLSEEEYSNIKAFVTGSSVEMFDLNEILMVADQPLPCRNAKVIRNPEIKGFLAVLRVQSVDLYFLRYLGEGAAYLNRMEMSNRHISLLAGGSVIRIPKSKPLYYGDIVSNFVEDRFTGKISFEARNLHLVFPNGYVGIRNISLAEHHGRLIGVMGASGSGKTTLLNVLCGLERPTAGEALINGINLHTRKDQLEGVIGYIPQDDLLIEELTVFENLYYNAQLCFRDRSREELEALVEKTLTSLGLYPHKDLKVGSTSSTIISGGQRKRLNIALELLREPSVLFVDEPTSGLSSNDSENVMDLMSELALKGKQIFVVIHQPSSDIFKMFDKIIILDTGGYMIYYGNPIEAVMYFKRSGGKINSEIGECPSCGNVNPELIFNIIEEKVVDEFGHYTGERKTTPAQWEKLYRDALPPAQSCIHTEKPPRSLHVPGWFRQMRIYLVRDFLSKISNRQYLLLTLCEAPLLAFILAWVIRYIADPLSDVYIFRENENIPVFIFMSLIVAVFLGLIVSAEEIFRDRKILRREAFLHLSRSSYLAAKIFILMAISALQSFLFVMIANTVLEVREMYFPYWLALFSTAVAANIMGLIISAAFNSAVTIYIVIPLLMIPMMVLSGAMFSFDKLNRQVGSVNKTPLIAELMITRWSYEALMVRQYKDNRFERHFYEVEKRESHADFRQAYLIPELRERCKLCINEWSEKGKIEKTINALHVLRNEVAKEIAGNPDAPQFDLSALYPEKLDGGALLYLQDFLEEMDAYYGGQFAAANREKEQLIAFMLKEDAQKYTVLKNAFHNEHLSETVRKFFEKNKILEFNNRLVRQIDPIYEDPEPAGAVDFRAHFFAPVKHFAGVFFDTYRFNITVIWIFSIFLYIILYFNLLKKALNFSTAKYVRKLRNGNK
jgi:ABC-type multidrug transport system ATPase subunit